MACCCDSGCDSGASCECDRADGSCEIAAGRFDVPEDEVPAGCCWDVGSVGVSF